MDEDADTRSVSEFGWDTSSRADLSVVSRAASSRSRRSSMSMTEHVVPQVSYLAVICKSHCQVTAAAAKVVSAVVSAMLSTKISLCTAQWFAV